MARVVPIQFSNKMRWREDRRQTNANGGCSPLRGFAATVDILRVSRELAASGSHPGELWRGGLPSEARPQGEYEGWPAIRSSPAGRAKDGGPDGSRTRLASFQISQQWRALLVQVADPARVCCLL